MAKRKTGIHPIIALVILVLVAAIGAGSSYLYINQQRDAYLEAEQEMPESAISTYLSQIKNQSFDRIYEDSMLIEPHLNSKEDYIEALKEIYAGVDVSDIQFVASEDSTDDNLIYQLVANRQLLANVHLVNSDGEWHASTIFSGDHDYTIAVPTGLTLTINGNPIGESFRVEENVVAGIYAGMNNTSAAPKVDVYRIENLLADPEIGIEGESGYATLEDVVTGTLYVGKEITDATAANAFINDITTVAKYPARETSLGAVSAVAVTNSDWYQRIRTLQNDWFTTHSTSYFSNQQAFNIIALSDDTMVGYVIFDYYAANSEVSRTWYCGYQLSLINDGGTWKIADMGVDSTLNPSRQ